MLRITHVAAAVPEGDQSRMDLVVSGLNVARGLPLFADVTVVSPISRQGHPRGGTSNRGGRLLEDAENDNNDNYRAVLDTGLGALYSLGFEVFGKWSRQCVELLPKLAMERARGEHPRLRRGIALAFQQRWSSILSVAVQRAEG